MTQGSAALGTPAFRGASRASVLELRELLTERWRSGGIGEELGSELFAVAGVLDTQPTLRRALTDPSRNPSDRAGLLRTVFGAKVAEPTLEVVVRAAELGWSRVRDLADALEYLGIFAEVLAADTSGAKQTKKKSGSTARSGLDELEDELFRFGRIVASNPELRGALADSTVPSERRAELAVRLLEGKAGTTTVRLVQQAIRAPRGQDLLEALDSYAEIAAAWRERLVATVRSAVPLDEAQQERLRGILARQYGRDVHVNLLVDPDLVGGMRIEVGDDVIDGSVAARLDDARRKLAS